jgi:hypothetical protein
VMLMNMLAIFSDFRKRTTVHFVANPRTMLDSCNNFAFVTESDIPPSTNGKALYGMYDVIV